VVEVGTHSPLHVIRLQISGKFWGVCNSSCRSANGCLS